MASTEITAPLPQEEKAKVAYALNLCAVSISQIIDSNDIVVLKQEREAILNNLNLQNFVKHPALLDVMKRILDTITYLEIQAGDLAFVEKEYQQKLKDAIWSAVPNPGLLFAGGDPVTLAIAVAAQIGTGYMNYRKNKSQYSLDRDKSIWELKRHELEQLYGLRAQLFETAWRLSADYDFDDKYRLTEKQLSRFSEALLEGDPLKRFERLDVMSDKFAAFPPFWYHKGSAAMEVYCDARYSVFSQEYKAEALKAYDEFHESHFEFLREDIIAASCCMEHISLLEPDDARVAELLLKAMRLAGDNYDVLQQSVFVNIRLDRIHEVVSSLREMIANDYNVGLNGILLSKIYIAQSRRAEYEKLRAIAGEANVPPWAEDTTKSEKQLVDDRRTMIADEYGALVQRVAFELIRSKSNADKKNIYSGFKEISTSLLRCANGSDALAESFEAVDSKLKRAVGNANAVGDFTSEAEQLKAKLLTAEFTMQIAEDAPVLIAKMKEIAKP